MGFEPTELSLGRFQGGCTRPLCDLACLPQLSVTDMTVGALLSATILAVDLVAGRRDCP